MIINTGTRAALQAFPGLAEAQPLTHIEALELNESPDIWSSSGAAISV